MVTRSGRRGSGHRRERGDARTRRRTDRRPRDVPPGGPGGTLEFAETNAFDGVVSALALGYVEDWRGRLSEFARILEPGGFLVLSTGHPLDQFPCCDDTDGANYFEVELRRKRWEVPVPYYRHPFSEVVDPLLEPGFRLETMVEPHPTAAFEEKRLERSEKESRYPMFLSVCVVNATSDAS